jgi:hypothetical protein
MRDTPYKVGSNFQFLYGMSRVTFQGGKKVDEAEIDLEDGVVWDEVSKGYYFL